jgi:uncharacterized iron-regulated protein
VVRSALLAVAVWCLPVDGPSAASEIDVFVAKARGADIVVLGEVHDNPEHHRNQAAIVAALKPAALVFEMIPQAREDDANALRETGASRAEIAEGLEWESSGWPDFEFYAPIMEAAPEARLFGAGQPVEDVRRAVDEGAADAFGSDAIIYGLDQLLEPGEQAVREAYQAEALCEALPPDMLPGMVEAQRFRDAGLADAALWARTMAGDGPVVVIAGTGHADRRRGVPAMIKFADPEVRVVSLGQFEQQPENGGDYDGILMAPAPERDDPCAAFGELGE